MEFQVLGPLLVTDNGEPVYVRTGHKPRLLLALLLARAGQSVSTDSLVASIWGDQPPPSARRNLQQYVHHIRRVLGAERLPGRAVGYAVITGNELDATRFRELAAAGSEALAAGDVVVAGRRLREALLLWRGPAFVEFLDCAEIAEEAARLEQARLGAQERWAEAELALGRHAELVAELHDLVRAHPYREELRGHLMLALYRGGRQAEALATYRETRAMLDAEFGVEPGAPLQRLHEAMLRGEEALAAAQPSRLVPRQLSAGIGDFTGRAHEVGVLGELLRTAGAARAVVVCAIAGMGGVGKTTLAVHAAHELAEAFLDGQLQVNLRGIDAPLDPAEVLERFLRVLGVDGSSVPEGVEERAAMYRSRLAGKRMLILLDNAAGEQQVRPLLPGTPGCAVLITSRVRLAGLEGAHHLDLAVLEPDQALGLLAHVVGAERLALDPAAAAEIARLCGHLPLGIRIAGARLAAHPLWPLGRMARLLDDERRRLDELNVGDLGVRASLGLSYEGLATGARRLYRLLGTLTTPDFAGWAAAALLDAGHEQTDAHLAALVEARLLDDAGIDATGQPRYRFHDLVRLHAKERADEEEPLGAARAAVIRALATWLGLAEQADRRLPGRIFEPRRGDAPRRLPPPELTGGLLAEPLAWFSAERAALRAAVQQAAGLDLAGLCWELANAAVNFHDLSDHYDDWESATRTGLTTCERSGDRRGQAVMLRNLAQWSRFSPVNADAMALEEAHAALRPFRELGDLPGEIDALVLISGAHLALGDPAQAMEAGAEAGAKARAHGYALGQAEAGYLMGFCHRVLTQFEQAGEELERGMRLAAGAGLTHQLARLLALLGVVRREQGRYAEAQEHLAGGIALARQLGNRAGEINLQVNLGITHLASSDPRARQVLETSLSLARRGNSTFDEALSLRGLGELELREGRYDAARENTSAALAMWRDLGSPYQEAQSLKILGQVHAAAGRPEAAGAAWTDAVALFQKIGNEAETAAVTALLAKRPP